MKRYDIWVMFILLLITLAACLPFDLPKPPPDFSPCPPPKKELVIKPAAPTASPSQSAIEYELDDVRSDLAACRRVLREFSCDD